MSTPKFFNRIAVCSFLLVTAMLSAGWTAAVQADDPPTGTSELRRELRDAYRAAKYEKALELATKLNESHPRDVGIMYNIACLNCLLGKKGEAYTWLEKAVDAGYSDANYLAHDYDFRTIWGEDRFRALLRRIRAAGGQGSDETRQPAKTDDKPKRADDETLTPREHGVRVGELTQKVIETSNAGKKEEALKYSLEALHHAEALHKTVGDDANSSLSLTNYNVACMYSILDRKELALKHLNKAIDVGSFGGDMVEQITGDADFANIRSEPGFKKALERAKSKRSAEAEVETTKAVDFSWSVTEPDGFSRRQKAPLIVALHHFSGSKERTTERWKQAANKYGALLLTPQGTVQMPNGNFEWGKDLIQVERDIMRAIDKVLDEYNVDKDMIVVGGFSQGGWIAWHLALKNPDMFCGAIPVCGRFDSQLESAFDDPAIDRLRVVVMIGANENEGVLGANRKAIASLKDAGVKTRINVYDGVAHGYPSNSDEELVKAIGFVLEARPR